MFKTLLIIIFIVVAFSPTFAILAVRDTTPVQVCDTLIDKNGVVSPAIIVSVGTDFIRFKQCSPNAKRIYTVERSKIREIKAHTFVQAKPIPLLKRAKRAFRTALISTLSFFISLLLVIPMFEGDSGDNPKWLIVPFIALLIAPFVIIGSFLVVSRYLLKLKNQKIKKQLKQQQGVLLSL